MRCFEWRFLRLQPPVCRGVCSQLVGVATDGTALRAEGGLLARTSFHRFSVHCLVVLFAFAVVPGVVGAGVTLRDPGPAVSTLPLSLNPPAAPAPRHRALALPSDGGGGGLSLVGP